MGAALTEMAIQTQKLTRTFGNLTAVDGIDLQVTAGQFFGFLGPNGAGKSTTIKILTGLLAPTSGSMQLLGIDFAANPVEVKRQDRSEEHTSELQSRENLVCRLLLEKKKQELCH